MKRIFIVLLSICLFFVSGFNIEEQDYVNKRIKLIKNSAISLYQYRCHSSSISLISAQTELNEINNIKDRREWFISYKKILEKYENILDSPDSVYDCLSEKEVYLTQKCIETETFGAGFEEKCNVASVILNRLESQDFPDEISEIIIPKQFAFGRENISEDTILALEYVFMVGDTTDGALYFHSNAETAQFNGANLLFTDAVGHHFYK